MIHRISKRISKTALGLLIPCAAMAPACSKLPPPGEVMVVVKTDMSLPKDIDRVDISVLVRGETRFNESFEKLGAADSLKIPASLGVTLGDSSDPATPFTFRVTAFQQGTARILREAVSTVPSTRLASMSLPVQWLCWDQVQMDSQGVVSSSCPDGQTCIAGTCTDKNVDSSKLPTFDQGSALGAGSDGSCFDTSACFAVATEAAIDLSDPSTCTFKRTGSFNAAIRAESSAGICGATGCFVPLDANSDEGWQRISPDTISLPTAICDRIRSGDAAGVSTADASTTCPMKTDSLPTCGPWSSGGAGAPTNSSDPVVMVANQDHPVAFGVVGTDLYWTNRGSLAQTGAVKKASTTGGVAQTLFGTQAFPNDLAIALDGSGTAATALYWANASDGVVPGTVGRLDISGATPMHTVISSSEFISPTGVAILGNNLFIADQVASGIFLDSSPSGASSTVTPIATASNGLPQSNPYRVTTDGVIAVWTNEGTGAKKNTDGSIAYDGSVMFSLLGDFNPLSVATSQDVPRNLVLDPDPNDPSTPAGAKTIRVYWTNYGSPPTGTSGSIMSATIDETMTPPVVTVTTLSFPSGVSRPYGLAIDATNLYWTNQGDSTVMAGPKTGGSKPQVLAEGQNAPGAMHVDATNVYWINEGGTTNKLGALMKRSKPAP